MAYGCYQKIKFEDMKTTEKINYGFKSELLSKNNPFLNFAKMIKQVDARNFIVEWQMGGNDKKEVFGEPIYGMTINFNRYLK